MLNLVLRLLKSWDITLRTFLNSSATEKLPTAMLNVPSEIWYTCPKSLILNRTCLISFYVSREIGFPGWSMWLASRVCMLMLLISVDS